MPLEPRGFTLFCDDVRHEVGNKSSLIGVYHGEMIIGGAFPATLPKLGLYVQVQEPASAAPEDMVVSVYMPGDSDEPSHSFHIEKPDEKLVDPDAAEDKLRAAILQFVISPCLIVSEGEIKVRLKRGSETIKLGALRVKSALEAS